jgi:hypothetical protein
MRRFHKRPRAITAILAASLMLAAATSTATARSLSFSNQNIRATWSSLEFNAGVTARCGVTLEGSFHSRTITKRLGTLIGAITRAVIDERNCTNGTGRARTETLPWHLTYEGFAGTLPNITTMLALISRFRLNIIAPGLCTADYGTATDNITGQANVAGREVTTLEPIAGRNTATRHSGSAFCPATGRFEGRGNVFLLNTTTRIRITLI